MQYLAIIRGAPASGKSTIAKKLRDFKKRVVWLKVDNFKDFFVAEATLTEQRFVDECALASLNYLLDEGFSVVMEKIFYDTSIIPLAVEAAKKRGIPVQVFQLTCPLKALQSRDRNRPGIKEGCRKLMGDEVIAKIYAQLEKTFYPGAFSLDTEKYLIEECIAIIHKKLRMKN